MQLKPNLPENNSSIGTYRSLLYSGSKFSGSQKSKGNSYDVEVVLQVNYSHIYDDYIYYYFYHNNVNF
jgi:hypothetical protein